MIDTLRAKAAPHDALSSSRKLIPLENVVWRLHVLSLNAMDPLPRHRQYGDGVGTRPDTIDLSEVVVNPSAVPFKVHWQNADRSDQAEQTAKTPASPQISPQTSSQPKQSGETDQSSQNQPFSQQHDDLKSSLRQRLHAHIDQWIDENMANLVEDALQAPPQSRTKPVDKPE